MTTQIKNNQLLISFLASIMICSLSSSAHAASGYFFSTQSNYLKNAFIVLAEGTKKTVTTAANAAVGAIKAVTEEMPDASSKAVQTEEEMPDTSSKAVQTEEMPDASLNTDESLGLVGTTDQGLLSRVNYFLGLIMPQAKKILGLEKELMNKKIDPENLVSLRNCLTISMSYVVVLSNLINSLEQVQDEILRDYFLLVIGNKIILDAGKLECNSELENKVDDDVKQLIENIKRVASGTRYLLEPLLSQAKLTIIRPGREESKLARQVMVRVMLTLTSGVTNQVTNILKKYPEINSGHRPLIQTTVKTD